MMFARDQQDGGPERDREHEDDDDGDTSGGGTGDRSSSDVDAEARGIARQMRREQAQQHDERHRVDETTGGRQERDAKSERHGHRDTTVPPPRPKTDDPVASATS